MRLNTVLRWVVLSVGVVLAIVLFYYDPAGNRRYPPCVFHWLTSWYCPGCGSTRALHELLHLDFMKAWKLNPLLVLSLPILGLAVLGCRPVHRIFRHPATPWIVMTILISYWIARNIPCAPFCYLAPH